jgi:Zn-dependent alcohol dehydrogenase
MNCPICKKETNVVCACGFCPICIKEHTHDGCSKILSEKQKGGEDDGKKRRD